MLLLLLPWCLATTLLLLVLGYGVSAGAGGWLGRTIQDRPGPVPAAEFFSLCYRGEGWGAGVCPDPSE